MSDEENFRPISYEFGTLEYALIYYALNEMALKLEGDEKAAKEVAGHLNTDSKMIHQKLDEILTDNADPDRE